MNSIEWLQSPTRTLDGKDATVLEELAQLVGHNGGMAWKGYGVMTTGGPLGRLGVSFEEAIRLLYLSGVLEGFTRSENGANKAAILEAIKGAIRKAAEEQQKPALVGVDGKPLEA